MRKNLIKLLLVYLFLAIIFSGCDSFDGPNQLVVVTTTPYIALKGPPNGKIGSPIAASDFFLSVENIEVADSYDDIQPESSNKYIAVELKFESRIDNFEDFDSFNARLQDKEGNLYFAMLGKEPWLPSSNPLRKGSKVNGWITFEVPKKLNDFWLIYQSFQHPESKPIIIDLTK